MSDEKLEKQRLAFKRWYQRHGEEYNRWRRKRYAEDKDYREMQQRATLNSRRRPKDGDASKQRIRFSGGVPIKVYTVTDIARICDVKTYTLLALEKKGWIPPPSFDGTMRVYTWNQVQLIEKFIRAIENDEDYEKVSSELFNAWALGVR